MKYCVIYLRSVVLKLFFAVDLFHCTQNQSGLPSFVNVLSIYLEIGLVTS